MRHNMAQHPEFNIRITDSDTGIVGNVFTHNLRDWDHGKRDKNDSMSVCANASVPDGEMQG